MEISRYEVMPYDLSDIAGRYVDEDDWHPTAGGVLVTEEAKPCVVIAVHEPKRGIGYMGHFTSLQEPYPRSRFDDMVHQIASDGPSKSLEAWVSGGATLNLTDRSPEMFRAYNQLVSYDRLSALEGLGSLGVKTTQKNWLEPNEALVSAVFNATEGKIDYAVNKI